ncbi:MAG: hypothetical protein J2P58_03015 [Acidimicrobiaceae bacterium]|nr:hypothetical protein [Acidimicrobiaceae bacterium]
MIGYLVRAAEAGDRRCRYVRWQDGSQENLSRPLNRREESGSMGIAISSVVFALGALLRFETPGHSSALGVHPLGVILMIVGAIAFVVSAWELTLDPSLHSQASPSASLRGKQRHRSKMYVFALPADRQARTRDPLDESQWRFFVVPTWKLDGLDRKTISEPMLTSMAQEVRYTDLPDAVRRAAELESGLRDDEP